LLVGKVVATGMPGASEEALNVGKAAFEHHLQQGPAVQAESPVRKALGQGDDVSTQMVVERHTELLAQLQRQRTTIEQLESANQKLQNENTMLQQGVGVEQGGFSDEGQGAFGVPSSEAGSQGDNSKVVRELQAALEQVRQTVQVHSFDAAAAHPQSTLPNTLTPTFAGLGFDDGKVRLGG
jgi:hypothetical protein